MTPQTLYEFVSALTFDPDMRAQLLDTISNIKKGNPAIQLVRPDKNAGRQHFEVRAFEIEEKTDGALFIVVRETSHNIKLHQELERLERLAIVGQIAAGVAHEFNNILTSMLGWTQIARQKKSTPQMVSSAVDIIGENAQRARDLAFQMLDVARDDADTTLEPVSLVQIADDVLRLLMIELDKLNIEVVRRFDDNIEPCLANNNRLWQVFVNLVRNAMDAMPDGGTLELTITQREQNIFVSIGDDGLGMKPEVKRHIFDPFFTTKLKGQSSSRISSGLGLAICREIVEEHGGTIDVASALRQGTVFTITLPVAQEGESEQPAPRTTTSSIPPGMNILIVDDEPDIGEMMRTALELKDASAVAVCSGEEAVDRCRTQQFDAAFIDFTMPGLSGKQLGQELHAVQPELPIIYMSGREVEVSPDVQIADFLKKPFDIQEVQHKLREVLEGVKRSEQPRPPTDLATKAD